MFVFDMLRKAVYSLQHPGVGSNVNLWSLIRRSLPYFLSPTGRSVYPLTIYFSINSVCNLHCKMCDVGIQIKETNFNKNLRPEGNRDQLSFDEFKAVIDQVKFFKPMIGITSTEPLLYKDIVKCIEYVTKNHMESLITTGGYLLPRYAGDLVRAGLKRLYVSIDGPPEVHNTIRGVKDSFERSTEGIREIMRIRQKNKASHPEVFINYTISNHNYNWLESFMDSIGDLDLSGVKFTMMNFATQEMVDVHNLVFGKRYPATVNCLQGGTNPRDIDTEILWQQLKSVKEKYSSYVEILPPLNRKELDIYFKEPLKALRKNRCIVSYFIAQIIANGDVIPYTRCYHAVLGNIRRQTFDEIWNGSQMRKFRRDLRKHGHFPACTRCDQVT